MGIILKIIEEPTSKRREKEKMKLKLPSSQSSFSFLWKRRKKRKEIVMTAWGWGSFIPVSLRACCGRHHQDDLKAHNIQALNLVLTGIMPTIGSRSDNPVKSVSSSSWALTFTCWTSTTDSWRFSFLFFNEVLGRGYEREREPEVLWRRSLNLANALMKRKVWAG